MHTDHDAPSSDVNPEAIKLGHEPDKIDVRTILYVPIVLVITFALAFATVAIIINNIRLPAKEPGANVLSMERNQPELKNRIERISSTDPKADVKAPRLEGLDRLSSENKPYFQSSERTKEGNSTDYHPEDMRPSSAHGKELGLQDYGWKDEKKNLVRIPIEEAIKILVVGGKDKADPESAKLYAKVLKFEEKVNPNDIRMNRPKASNPFWGMPKTEGKKEDAKEKH